MQKVRIVEVIEDGKTYFIVQRKSIFLFWNYWNDVGTDYTTFRYDTLEQAEKIAKEVSKEHPPIKRVVSIK